MRRLALASLLLLAACGGDDTSDSSTASDGGSSATEPATANVVATDPDDQAEPADAESNTAEVRSAEPTEAAANAESTEVESEASSVDAAEDADPTGELAPFEPIGPGPYAVGVQTITITDEERDRPLTVDVWFPLEPGVEGDPHQYTFIPGTYYESPDAITASLGDIADDGPYPLVAYSHGSGGVRYQHSDYTETLASHGYIVAAPDHTGNTAVDRIAGGDIDVAAVAYDRTADVVAVIDAMTETGNSETKGWAKRIDDESIAVTGHSFGGFTTLAVDSGFENSRGAVEADPRVDALIALAPAVGDGGPRSLLDNEELARIDAPLLVMVGTNDQTTPSDPNVERIWENASSPALYRAELVDAQHQTFSDACAYLEDVPDLPDAAEVVIDAIEALAVEGCSPGDMEIERAQELTNTLALRFLGSVFADGEMITVENTELPGDLVYYSR